MSVRELTCIVCPNSCNLKITVNGSDITVEGNKCPRGSAFGKNEITNPVRTVTYTCATSFPDTPVLPCRTSKEIPKDKVFDVINEINKVVIDRRISRGDIIIENVLGLDSNIIATADLQEEKL